MGKFTSPSHLQVIAERAAKATPGDWTVRPNGIGLRGSSFMVIQDDGIGPDNAEFIAHARQDMIAVLAVAEARKQALEAALVRAQNAEARLGVIVSTRGSSSIQPMGFPATPKNQEDH